MPGRTAERAASSASRARWASAATSCDTSPQTNVRVMSAQQPLSSSRGQRSTVIGRSAGSGPEPGSCPPPDSAETTMMSGGAGAPAAAHAVRMPERTVSAVSASRRPRPTGPAFSRRVSPRPTHRRAWRLAQPLQLHPTARQPRPRATRLTADKGAWGLQLGVLKACAARPSVRSQRPPFSAACRRGPARPPHPAMPPGAETVPSVPIHRRAGAAWRATRGFRRPRRCGRRRGESGGRGRACRPLRRGPESRLRDGRAREAAKCRPGL
jgi:hypothetical protein